MPFAEQRLDLATASLISAGATSFSVSDEGTLVARTETPSASSLAWLDRDGAATTAPGDPILALGPWIAISPDGDRVAYVTSQSGAALMMRDLTTGADTRLTADSSGQNVVITSPFTLSDPDWFPRGSRLSYTRGPIEGSQIVAQRADGAEEPSVLTPGRAGGPPRTAGSSSGSPTTAEWAVCVTQH